jgi:HD-like signal output (HDOD) protein
MMTATFSATACRDRALKAIAQLPPFSPVLNQLIASLASEDIGLAELAGLVEKDTVLAGNVLRLVNSALYARRGTVNSVRHAISILGLSKLRNAAMSWSMARMWNAQKLPPGWSAARFNLHGAASAIVADLLAVEACVEYAEGAFAAGLLQNVGMLLVARALPEEHARIRQSYLEGTRTLVECEREVTGVDHAELSAETLAHWNLPEPIVQAVRCHHTEFPAVQPGSDPVPLGLAVQVADRFVEQSGISFQEWHRAAPGSPEETLIEQGLHERAPAILERFHIEYETIKSFFA